MAIPIQKALKLPATKPERMPREAPPSLAEVTTSRQWMDLELVNTFTSSGIKAAARVPQLMIMDKVNHRLWGKWPICQ